MASPSTREAHSSTYARAWCFTAFSPDHGIHEDLAWPWEDQTYGVYQHEQCPTTGRFHIQGYVSFSKRKRLSQLKRFHGTAHFAGARGSAIANHAYCTKEATRVPGTFPCEYGDIATDTIQPGKRSDLEEAFTLIRGGVSEVEFASALPAVWLRYPTAFARTRLLGLGGERRDIECVLYYGMPGCGKSSEIYRRYPGAYWKSPGKWWDGYSGQSVVVFDDYDGSWWPCVEFLRIVNPFPLLVEIKGGVIPMVATKFIISSNQLPTAWYSKHYELVPQHKEAVTRRIDTVVCHTSAGWTVQTSAEFFAPCTAVQFTGYNFEPEPDFLQLYPDLSVVQGI